MDNTPHTIGIEIEGAALTRESVAKMIKSDAGNADPSILIREIAKDASVESRSIEITDRVNLFLGNTFLSRNLIRGGDVDTLGYEIVTKPMNRPQMKRILTTTMSILKKRGEIFSPRSSIHVHIGFPKGLIFYKTSTAMGFKVEPLLYKLAGMGTSYRGQINRSAYAKPLCLPPAVRICPDVAGKDPELFCLDPRGAVRAADEQTFWLKFGLSMGDTNRYTPLRYFGINLFSVLIRGTLEFRMWNFTDNVKHIVAVAELSQLIGDLMIRLPMYAIDSISDISMYKKNDDSEYLNLLDHIIRLGDFYESPLQLSSESVDSLIEIIHTTPQPVFENTQVMTHLKKYTLPGFFSAYLTRVKSAADPGIIDIHNFNEQNHTIIE